MSYENVPEPDVTAEVVVQYVVRLHYPWDPHYPKDAFFYDNESQATRQIEELRSRKLIK